ncbi:MAG TPA: hypothetical protein VNE62_09090 [Actinomycetota bacterium]|nr:hypothetical protein [Actinomycetota bacterium]
MKRITLGLTLAALLACVPTPAVADDCPAGSTCQTQTVVYTGGGRDAFACAPAPGLPAFNGACFSVGPGASRVAVKARPGVGSPDATSYIINVEMRSASGELLASGPWCGDMSAAVPAGTVEVRAWYWDAATDLRGPCPPDLQSRYIPLSQISAVVSYGP